MQHPQTRKKNQTIRVNMMADYFGENIAIERVSFNQVSTADQATLNNFEEGSQSHRHDGHAFFLLEKGIVELELDFEKYTITPQSILYVHPDQVHRTLLSGDVIVSSWAITNENLNPEYLKLLEGIAPAKPLLLDKETFSIFTEAVSLFILFASRKNDKLYHSLLKDSCNALVALVISQYSASAKQADKPSRFDVVTKTFRELLERNYIRFKSPAEYAKKLHISTSYLNECVKNASGYPVSHHIQQRVILEAKRLLYHSDKSVKEIAAMLGYDDYPYFSRLFAKVTGITALTFRNKNRG